MKLRVLLTMSRSWTEWSTVRRVFERILADYPGSTLVHGDAPKGDRQAAGMWMSLGGAVEAWPADWSRGKAAGLRRNVDMVLSDPDLTVAFIANNSAGASHCAEYSESKGVRTVRYTREAT